MKALISIIMGSQSDLKTVQEAINVLKGLRPALRLRSFPRTALLKNSLNS